MLAAGSGFDGPAGFEAGWIGAGAVLRAYRSHPDVFGF